MSGMVEGIQLNVVDGPVLWREPQSEGAVDNISAQKDYSALMLAMRSLALEAMTLLMSVCSSS